MPSSEQQRKMFSVALKVLIKTAMDNHLFSFNGSLFRQRKGGAIGSTLTGAIAVLFTLRWYKDLKIKLNFATTEIPSFRLYMLKIYIDDENILCETFPLGSRLCSDGKIRIIESEIEKDRDIPGDQRTAKLFLEIANSVCDFIKLTVDCPSMHSEGFMPILDTQVKIENNKCIFKFYKKKVANPLLMLESSAMPNKIKRNALVQEGIRRLRNTSRELPWQLKADILSEFSHKMMMSGYNAKFRLEIIQSAVRGYDRQCDAADRGIRPLYRPRDFQAEERRKSKLLTKTSWHRPASAVGFIPATPGAELAKDIQRIVTEETARLGLSAKIIETGGKSLRQHLVRLDLTGCFYPDCYLCECDDKGASHTRSGAHYSGICLLCKENNKLARYDGESGLSGYYRSTIGHKKDIIDKNDKNAFAKHLTSFHPDKVGDPAAFKLKVESTHKKCLERQVSEGIYIVNSEADYLLNSKSEYLQPAVRRVITTREVRDHGS